MSARSSVRSVDCIEIHILIIGNSFNRVRVRHRRGRARGNEEEGIRERGSKKDRDERGRAHPSQKFQRGVKTERG